MLSTFQACRHREALNNPPCCKDGYRKHQPAPINSLSAPETRHHPYHPERAKHEARGEDNSEVERASLQNLRKHGVCSPERRELLDHLIRAHEDRLWDCQAERLGGLEVDDQLECRRLLNG